MLGFRVIHDHASLRLEVCFFLGLFVFDLVVLISNNVYESVFGDLGWDEGQVSWVQVSFWQSMHGLNYFAIKHVIWLYFDAK